MPFIEENFFCNKDFVLESLDKKFSPNNSNIKMTNVYDSLFEHTDLFTKAKKIRVRTETGRKIIDILSNKPSNIEKLLNLHM